VNRKTLQAATATTVGLAGTMPYLSPEQLEGGDASARSDIWALGIVIYEMAAGVKPFRETICIGFAPASLMRNLHRCLKQCRLV
jgi:serine/threonine protein kinase